MVLLSRLAILLIIFFTTYYLIKYIIHPKRKLENAQQKKTLYIYDSPNNVSKNFLLTYQGALFEGEKSLGIVGDTFDVTAIFIRVKDTNQLLGFTYEDLIQIETEIKLRYPDATIEWQNPMKELLQNKRSSPKK